MSRSASSILASLSLHQVAAVAGVLLLLVVPTGAIVVNQFDAVGPDESIVLAPATGPNGAYAQIDASNELTLNITEHGVNPDAVTVIDGVFTVTNTGNSSVRVWITQTNVEAVTFYSAASGQPVGAERNVTLVPGEELLMSVRIDTRSPGVAPESTLVTKLILNVETIDPTTSAQIDVPDSVDAGEVPLGTSAVVDVTVRNTGGEPLVLRDLAIVGDDAAAFESELGALPTIAPGGSATIPIRFAPEAEGDATATLRLGTNDPNAATATVTLRGEGTIQSLSVIGTRDVDFGDVRVGDRERTAVTVANTGSAPVTIRGVSIEGTDAAAFAADDGGAPVTLAPGARHVLVAAFEPTAGGSQAATLAVETDADDSPLRVDLAGRGLAPDIAVPTETVAFEPIGRGLNATATFTVENRGTAPLTITDVAVVGSGREMFAVTSDLGTPLTLDVGASETVTVRFEPTDDGAFTAGVRFESNDPNEPTARVGVSGTGLPPHIDVSTDHLDFGNVTVGGSKTLNITLSNPGDPAIPVRVTDVRFVSGSSEAFEIVEGEAPFEIAPGETERVTIRYAPQSVGIKTAQLRIISDADQEQIDIWMSNTGWRIRVQQLAENDPGVDSDVETWTRPVTLPDAASAELDANDVPPGVGLTVDVSVPSTREKQATITTVSVAPRSESGEKVTFDMHFVHHDTAPGVVGGVQYEPEAGRAVTQHFGLEHTIPNERLGLTEFTYSVKKSALPADVDPEDLRIYRYADGRWNRLNPELIDETATAYVFFVDPPGFSQFVLTAPEGEPQTEPGDDGPDGDGDPDGDDDPDDEGDEDDDGPETVVRKGDTTITFPGEENGDLADLIDVQDLGVPAPDVGGRDGPEAAIAQGREIGENAERIDFGDDISLTISGEGISEEEIDLKGADTLTLVRDPILLVGSHSLFGSKESIDDNLRMIHRVEITVPPEYENRSAILQLRVPRERFGETDPANATVARNSGGWQLLETEIVEETPEYVVLSAYTPGFSEFAVFADNSVTYEWTVETYDEPFTGRQIEPSFDAVGIYETTLTVTDAFGLTDAATYRILVNDVPGVAVQRPPVIWPNETVTLVADVVDEYGNVTVTWEFSDGTTATGRVVDRRFPAGTETITVVAADEFGARGETIETVTVGRSLPSVELQQIPVSGLGWLLLGLLLLLLVFARDALSGWIVAAVRRHPPEITAFESPSIDVVAARVVIERLAVRDRGDDLDEISVEVRDPSGRRIGMESGTIGGERTYEGTKVYVTLDESASLPPDAAYTVRVRVTDEAGAECVERATVRSDPFRYPLGRPSAGGESAADDD
ncbi:choice-of-anchor D domain-containing protein [Halobellus rubicundus]|uniref:Choice-of-anchor D domain-containing protein n=1 Tax=Halobellus rubicundus TaxID=2996466 RepID=A0ABD5M8G9_9EURY